METKTLKQQLTSAEGEANYLLTENESLRKEIEDLERGKILKRTFNENPLIFYK